jgi:HSP20 family protein
MPEVAVTKKTSEHPTVRRFGDVLQPMFAFSRAGWSPFAIMREFANEMDRVFRSDGSEVEMQAWAPITDVQRCNGNLVISAELPGLKKEDVKVELTEDTLVIHGERKREHKEDHEGYHRWERSYGQFYRSIKLPEGAKTDHVKAELKDGILKISVPVPEAAKKSRDVQVTG